jgi:serine O-acetyltransferase
MNNFLKELGLIIGFVRYFPHLLVYFFHRRKHYIEADIVRWLQILKINHNKIPGLIYLISYFPEFRNLFYNRVGFMGHILNLICPRMSTLYIHTKDIGEGLYLQHGFSTTIAARSIGKNCWINQQVTIGYSNDTDIPIIRDNVTISAGAIVIGNITLGDNSKIGANAVVVKDVPENSSVFCPPPFTMKWEGPKKG